MKKILGLLVLSMMFLSCDKNSNEPIARVGAEDGKEVASKELKSKRMTLHLNLEAEYNTDALEVKDDSDEMRALKLKIKPENKWLNIQVPDEGLDILCFFRNKYGTKRASKVVHFDKVKGSDNKVVFNGDIELDFFSGTAEVGFNDYDSSVWGQRYPINDELYLMGVIGGKMDGDKLLINPNEKVASKMKIYSVNDVVTDLDIPAVSAWTKLPRIAKIKDNFINYNYKGRNKVKTPIKAKFYAQGMIIRHRIKENKTKYDLQINSFKILSTAFMFKGISNMKHNYYFNASVNTQAGPHNAYILNMDYRDPYLNPHLNNEDKFLPSANGFSPEYVQEFKLIEPLTIPAGGRAEDKLMVFWAMPSNVPQVNRKTNIYINALAVGANAAEAPKMEMLNVYGSKHENIPKFTGNNKSLATGFSAIMSSTIERPKLAIEYVDEYNLKSKQTIVTTNSLGIPQYSSTFSNALATERATEHDYTATSALRYGVAKQSVAQNFPGYHIPTYEELCGIIPFQELQYTEGSLIDGKPIYITLINFHSGRGLRSTQELTMNLAIKGVENAKAIPSKVEIKNFSGEYQKGQSGCNYAVLFKDWNGDNKMRVAYRYYYADATAPKVLAMQGTFLQEYVAPEIQGSYHLENDPTSHSQNSIWSGSYKDPILKKVFVVEMYYLGNSFLGSVDDVATEKFWKVRQADVVKRVFPLSYTSFTYLGGYNSIRTKHHSISSNTMTLWINKPSYSTSTPKGIVYEAADAFMLSGNKGGQAYLDNEGGVDVGRSVRLFSDN